MIEGDRGFAIKEKGISILFQWREYSRRPMKVLVGDVFLISLLCLELSDKIICRKGTTWDWLLEYFYYHRLLSRYASMSTGELVWITREIRIHITVWGSSSVIAKDCKYHDGECATTQRSFWWRSAMGTAVWQLRTVTKAVIQLPGAKKQLMWTRTELFVECYFSNFYTRTVRVKCRWQC